MTTRPFWLLCITSLACTGREAGESARPPATPVPATASVPALAHQADDRRTAGQPGCLVERPQMWPTGSGRVSWIGECRAGFADGSGVVLRVVEGVEPERFYGRIESGYLLVGVLQTPSGFMAGTWKNGALVGALANDVAQRNSVITAFDIAANAAVSVSRTFAKKDDRTASRYYARQAKLLREGMD